MFRPTRACSGAAWVLALGTLISAPSFAKGSFSSLTIFGDSLSDTGNVFLATGGALPVAPYLPGRFSDGPVWVEHLADGLGLSHAAKPAIALTTASHPALGGGSNFAFGGARTGTATSPVPDLLVQMAGMAFAHPGATADPNGLYVLVGGGNDMRDARSAFQTGSAADQFGRQAAAEAAAANLATGLGLLASKGAKHVLISNLPDLGRTIEAAVLGLQEASTDATNRFNDEVADLRKFGRSLGLKVSFLDMAGVANAVFVDASVNGGATYGITNIGTPCGGFTGSIGISCSVSAFSDALHPSAAVHQLIGKAAVAAAVPEPETYALMAFGLGVVAWAARRRQRRGA
jgi:outer membrane lipase/esterase